MSNSQKSFEVLLGRFENGDAYIQTLPDYNPTKVLIKKANLTLFIADVKLKDEAVNTALNNWKNAVVERKTLAFKGKNCDDNCLEKRIRNIRSYIGAEISRTCGEYKIISSFIKKIAPVYEKPNPALPKGSGKSPSEKSFVALNGYGTQTSELINNLGVAYSPQNPFIEAAAFETFVNDMIAKAKSIAKLEGKYADAVKARFEIYHGTDGLVERQTKIKDYLASFTGEKKNPMYIEFDRLIKGK
jgi:hypothetical protein